MNFKYAFGALVLGLFFWFADITPHWGVERDYKSEVVQVYSGTSSGKYSHLEFIGVYREVGTGIMFDRRISASEYSITHVGDIVTINTRPMDVEVKYRMIGPTILGMLAFMTKFFALVGTVFCSFLTFGPWWKKL